MTGTSAVARVETALEAAHASQPTLNAFTSFDDERALERAAGIAARVERGEDVGPLNGMPIAVKDLIDHEGRITTNGSAFYREVAGSTAPCIKLLESADGIVIGRTGLHEWAFGFSSENPHWGPVRNPWDTETSAGGSSGGSAAAVAAGIVRVALGTDTGGSVRVPAALSGTYGLKVTHGRIPLEGVFPLVPSIDTVGPIACSIDDLETSYRLMSGDDTPLSAGRRLRIGLPEPWYQRAPLEEDVAREFAGAVDAIRDLGHQVHPIDLPDVHPSPLLWNAIALEVRETHRAFREQGLPYGEDVAKRLDDADAVGDEDVASGARWQEMIRNRFSDAFETVDLLMTPTVPVRKKQIGQDFIGENHYRSVLSYFSAVVNHSLRPAIALPLLGAGRPPASIQVIGPMHGEHDLIGFAAELDDAGLTGFTQPRQEFT